MCSMKTSYALTYLILIKKQAQKGYTMLPKVIQTAIGRGNF